MTPNTEWFKRKFCPNYVVRRTEQHKHAEQSAMNLCCIQSSWVEFREITQLLRIEKNEETTENHPGQIVSLSFSFSLFSNEIKGNRCETHILHNRKPRCSSGANHFEAVTVNGVLKLKMKNIRWKYRKSVRVCWTPKWNGKSYFTNFFSLGFALVWAKLRETHIKNENEFRVREWDGCAYEGEPP